MKLVSGDTYWTRINPVPHQHGYLAGDLDCDIVILGAGVTGAICAYYLAEAGMPAVVLDGNLVGYGSTSASTSILQYEIDIDMIGLQGQIGAERATRAFQLCADALNEIGQIVPSLPDDCGFTPRDCLYFTDKPSEKPLLARECDLRKNRGFDVEFLDDRAAGERFAFPVQAGIYSRGLAGEIDPYRFTHALLLAAEEHGVRVYENTAVTRIDAGTHGVTLTTANGFRVKARKLVIAAGYESTRYIPRKIATLTRSFTIVTGPIESVDGWYNRCVIRDTSTTYTYIRSTPEGRIFIGGEDLDVGGSRSKMAGLDNNDPVSLNKYKMLEDRLRCMFPGVGDFSVDFRFSGLFADTQDSLPYIGEHPAWPNCYFSLGYGSNGILYGMIGGRLIRDMLRHENPPDADLFRFGRRPIGSGKHS